MLNYHELRLKFKRPVPNKISTYILLAITIAEIFLFAGCVMAMTPSQWQSLNNLHKLEHNGVTQERVINAIIGEAENQGYEGMVLIAYAIINRGTLKGVRGENALRVKQHEYSAITLQEAQEAWKFAFQNPYDDPTDGATHWENVKRFGTKRWMKNMTITYTYKDHVFFR